MWLASFSWCFHGDYTYIYEYCHLVEMTGVKYHSQDIIKTYIMSNNKEQQWYEEIFPRWCADDIINEVIQMLWKKSIPLSLVFFNVSETSSLPFTSLLKSNPFEHFPTKNFLDFFKVLNCSVELCENKWTNKNPSVKLKRITKMSPYLEGTILPCKSFKRFLVSVQTCGLL